MWATAAACAWHERVPRNKVARILFIGIPHNKLLVYSFSINVHTLFHKLPNTVRSIQKMRQLIGAVRHPTRSIDHTQHVPSVSSCATEPGVTIRNQQTFAPPLYVAARRCTTPPPCNPACAGMFQSTPGARGSASMRKWSGRESAVLTAGEMGQNLPGQG